MKYSLIFLALIATTLPSLTEAKTHHNKRMSHIHHSKVIKSTKIHKAPVSTHKKQMVGLASWYGYESGPRTASGEHFNPKKLTAAHKHINFGTKVKVTNLKNKKSVVVTVNDRGPFVRGRIIDLSKAAAKAIDMKGTQKVELTIIG